MRRTITDWPLHDDTMEQVLDGGGNAATKFSATKAKKKRRDLKKLVPSKRQRETETER